MLDSVKNDRSRGLLRRLTNALLTGDVSAFVSVADDGDDVVAVVVVAVKGGETK